MPKIALPAAGADVAVLGFHAANPVGYGRLGFSDSANSAPWSDPLVESQGRHLAPDQEDGCIQDLADARREVAGRTRARGDGLPPLARPSHDGALRAIVVVRRRDVAVAVEDVLRE